MNKDIVKSGVRGQANIFLVAFIAVVISVVSGIIVVGYNGIVKDQKNVEAAKADIGAVCQRRLDLLPNLIETVKAYAKHEQTTLLAVAQARSQAMEALGALASRGGGLTKQEMAGLEASQAGITSAMRSVFALAENYPDLKASSNFMALQDQFEGTENRIAVARQRYNAAVRQYNSRIETFPGVFLAPMFGYSAKDYFEAKEAAYEPVKAEF